MNQFQINSNSLNGSIKSYIKNIFDKYIKLHTITCSLKYKLCFPMNNLFNSNKFNTEIYVNAMYLIVCSSTDFFFCGDYSFLPK